MATSWASLGGKVIDHWFWVAYTPAFAFWAGGVALFVLSRSSWSEVETWIDGQSQPWLVTLGILALLGIHASAVVIEVSAGQVIRWLEGYWPRGLWSIERSLVRKLGRRHKRSADRCDELAGLQRRTFEQDRELARLHEELLAVPDEERYRMPTRLGNVLRTAEMWPLAKYGLDAVVCWPRLWLLLPEPARQEIGGAQARLESAAQVWVFGILFLAWTPVSPWAVPVALAAAWFSYRRLLAAAKIFGALLESAFDLYRTNLYVSLGWPLPVNPYDDHDRGKELTEYLSQGSDRPSPQFTWARQERTPEPPSRRVSTLTVIKRGRSSRRKWIRRR